MFFKILAILFMSLLLSCNEDKKAGKKCDSSCKSFKAEFEHSTNEVIFSTKKRARRSIGESIEDRYISVTKTTTEVLAECRLYKHPKSRFKSPDLKLKLDMKEWLDFTKALSELHINEWKSIYHSDTLDNFYGLCWRLEIISLNIYKSNVFSGCNEYPPNWDEFIKIMDDMEAKIKEKAEISDKFYNYQDTRKYLYNKKDLLSIRCVKDQ